MDILLELSRIDEELKAFHDNDNDNDSTTEGMKGMCSCEARSEFFSNALEWEKAFIVQKVISPDVENRIEH